MSNLAFLPIALPFLAFATTLILPKQQVKKIVSLLFAATYAGIGLWTCLSTTVALPITLQMGGWESPFGISLVYDRLSALLVTVTGFVYFAVTLYAVAGNNAEKSPLLFPLIHILVCGISGAFTTGDLFNLYVWFEVILLSSFVLFSLGHKPMRMAGAFKYVVLNLLSSLVFLAAAGLIYNATHTLNFTQLTANLQQLALSHPNYVLALNGLLFSAFAIKSALFPFFFWLPASYHALSPAVSALFAGLLTKVGLYAIFRVNLFIFPESEYIQTLLAILAGLSILLGVAGAIIQTNIRRILGFHIISQVGYIALAGVFAFSIDADLRLFGIAAALFYMAHHILVKANLYLVSGLIRSLTGSERLQNVCGLIARHGLIAFLFAVPALSLAGIPPLSGFWAKLGLFQASLESEYFLAVAVMVVGGFFTVFSMTKIWLGAFWGEPKSSAEGSDFGGSVPSVALAACLLLSCLTIAIGLNPDILFTHAEAAAQALIQEGHYYVGR